ncbi:TolC family protein [Neptunomonas antarctica]|uniref:Efflux transporter, outer membrane factor (OMF) lipoprotein, NodT family n=1 Tax=Neptunomonas antarctica TaxID=619304 RepID=A0A1N7KZW5_9GAMM|nr:TolC family protein [Neptunomonas antarctica]SIS67056.1 efflux transporter, outer membrane factor (OMF) lipoprotein, NodT family [Neptunomonas antarctica]
MKLTFLTGTVVIGTAIILAGCAVTPPTFEQLPQQSPLLKETWISTQTSTQASTLTLTESLLALFDDASLTQLVKQSQQRNLSLLQQKSAMQAMAATLTQADAALYPEVSSTLLSSRQDTGSSISQNHSLTLDVSWELDLWGRWGAESDAVLMDFEASRSTYLSLKDSIAAQTMQAYIDAVSQSQLAALSDEKYLSFEKTLTVVLSQYQSGTADLDELTEARQNLASARADRVESKLLQRNAIRTLQVLAGGYPDGMDFVGSTLPVMLSPPDADVPATVLARRPDVQSAWFSVQSAAWTVAAKEAAQLPDISLTTTLGNSSESLKDLLTGDTIWNLAASIGYTLFDSGALKAQVTQSQSLAEQSYYLYLETLLTALNEVETGLDTEQAYYKFESAQREVVVQASLLLANAEQDYRDGLIDISDWLTYQRSYFDEQSALIDALNQRLQNRVSLGLALGLGV